MMGRRGIGFVFAIGLILTAFTGQAQETRRQEVLGSGTSTAIAQLFFKAFEKKPEARGYTFNVDPRSTKHAGGIRASSFYLFGRTGRPLKEQVKSKGKFEIFLAGAPIGFVAGAGAGVSEISFQQARDIFLRRVTNWKDVGGSDASIILLGREKTESALGVLRVDFPFLDQAEYSKIFYREHDVVDFLNSDAGRHAIGFGAFSNFKTSRIVRVSGYDPVLQVGLVVDRKNAGHPVVKAVREFTKSGEWLEMIKSAGLLPPGE